MALSLANPCGSSQAVQWVEVWALAISRQRLTVKLDPVYRLNARLVQVIVCTVEGEGMAREGYDLWAQAELSENVLHRRFLWVYALHGFGVVLVKLGDEHEEISEAPFLKNPHQTLRRARV